MSEHRLPLAGEIDLATAAQLQAKLMIFATVTTDDLVLDCTDVEFIDSTGIAVVAHIHQQLNKQHRRLRIVGMNDHVRRPFDVLGLTERLGIGELDPAS